MMISEEREKALIESLRKRGIKVSKTEDKFALELRKRKVPYKRQEKIGRYRVDFCIPELIVVDVYGPHHEELRQSVWDMERLSYLRGKGLRVYIFSASEVYESPGKYAQLVASEYERLRRERVSNTARRAEVH
jgi:very-short-patch-repair endonuclease